MPDIFEYARGNSPLLVSFPHDGTRIPPELISRFSESGKSNVDCDWFISDLYAFISALDISFIKPAYSRYVVDLNRSPEGEALYPGRMETTICPLTTFSGDPVYLPGNEPDKNEIQSRIDTYWQPYHRHIRDELERLRTIHGKAVLWDAHSIASELPRLFNGQLPDLNFGTADGASCQPQVIEKVTMLAKQHSDYSVVLNGRFKGGYITRHYGEAENNVNAIQLEINQSNYLAKTNTPQIGREKAQQLSQLLQQFIQLLANADQ